MPEAERRRCPECGEALALRAIPEFRGEAAGVVAEFTGFRALLCARHAQARRLPQKDFAADLVCEVLDGAGPLRARSRGLLRKRWVCGRCGGELAAASPTGELRSRVQLPGAAPFTLTLAAPLSCCDGCRARQIVPLPELRSGIERAILAALAAAGLVPD